MLKRLNNTHLLSDTMISICLLLLFLFLAQLLSDINSLLNRYDELTMTMLGIFATILGFLITSVSILLTVKDTKFIIALKNNKKFFELLKVFIWTCYLITANIILLFLLYILQIEYISIWILSLFLTIISSVRLLSCFKILRKVIDLATD